MTDFRDQLENEKVVESIFYGIQYETLTWNFPCMYKPHVLGNIHL